MVPPQANNRTVLVMLKVYLDRGAKSDANDGVVAVAATVFKPLGYKRFVRPWTRMLRGWGASAFHATDFYNGAKDFKRDTPGKRERYENDSKLIPKLVGKTVEHILVVAARPDEFKNEASEQWKITFGTNVHSIGVQMILIAMGWWAEEHHFNERFAYFRESGDEDDAEVAATVERMGEGHADTARMIRVSSFAHIEKGIAKGTEASDFIAWHWNKWYMDKVRRGEAQNPRKDLAA
jgi:peptide subunit release factor RF-3